MKIFDHFRNIKLTDDQERVLEHIECFLKGDDQVFVLQGYAGTGKTTILKGIVTYLEEKKKYLQVMAPTGRAAKVLRNIVGTGSTIHRGIYNFEDVEVVNTDKEDAEKSFQYIFPVRDVDETHRIAIVDEASMISDNESNQEFFTYGSGRLLSDLISYMKLYNPIAHSKIIFVGDPAQLPPVGDPTSEALNEKYFQTKGIKYGSALLTTVLRQKEESLLIRNAFRFRNLIDNSIRRDLYLDIDEKEVLSVPKSELADVFCKKFPNPKIGNGVIISFSNKQGLGYNQAIRSTYFPAKKNITAGDIVLINNNNYNTYATELYNGDLAQVVWVSDTTESQSAPVMVEEGGSRVRKNISITFRNVSIKLPDFEEEIQCKIIDSLLNSPNADLTSYEKKALYINFVMRFNSTQQKRKENGLSYFKEGSTEFKDALRDDLYIRALKVKYGYAITCHKAQGGEWEEVFVDFSNRIGYNNDVLRWCYTAITRCRERLHVINPPDFRGNPTFRPVTVSKLNKIPANAIQYFNVPESPWHDSKKHPTKRLKYYELADKIAQSGFIIENLESKDYREIYTIRSEQELIRMDGIHNGAGIFRDFTSDSKSDKAGILLELTNSPFRQEYSISYQPTSDLYSSLFSKISELSQDLNIQITNVEEVPNSYYVNYFFKIDRHLAQIQFYFNAKEEFTYIVPKSEAGADDSVLIELLTKLS
jgi:hypothetical protein